MECRPISQPFKNRRNSLPHKSEPVGTRKSDDFPANLKALLESTAESTALCDDLVSIVEAWPALPASVRRTILKLIVLAGE